MKMKSVRLFIGGLGEGVNETQLTSKLSTYGSVSNVEVKEKTDAEGNVTLRFAYVNIEAPQDHLENCLSTLNGDTWSGSNLRVEVAKESFLDRLKRERAKRLGQQEAGVQTKEEEGPSGYEAGPKKYEVIPNEKRKIWQDYAMDSGVLVEKSSHPTGGQDVWPPKEDTTVKKKNEKEELMLESFKSFSSFWADSDEDEQTVPTSTTKRKRQLDNEQPEGMSNLRDDEMEVPTCKKVRDKRENWGRLQKPDSHEMWDSKDPSISMKRYDPALENLQLKKSSPAEVEMEVKEKEDHSIQHIPQQPMVFSQKSKEKIEENQKVIMEGSSSFSLLSLFSEIQSSKKEVKEIQPPKKEVKEIQPPKKEVQEIQPPKEEEKDQVKEIKSKVISNEAEGLKKTEDVESMCTNLMSMFTDLEAKEESENRKYKPPPSLPKYLQRKPFFLIKGDERLLDGINWVKSYDEEEILKEFKAVEEDLYDVIKTRSIRATRELNKSEDQSTKKRFKKQKPSESAKQSEVSVFEEDNFYDRGWRLAELEKQKKEKKDQNDSSKHESNNDSKHESNNDQECQYRNWYPRFKNRARQMFNEDSSNSHKKENADNGRR